jgi:hypothetical protein
MKTFAGDQFHSKKPKIAPDIAQEDVDAIINTPHPATRPSRPSIKLIKLIIAVIMMINNSDIQIGLVRLEKFIRNMAVTS